MKQVVNFIVTFIGLMVIFEFGKYFGIPAWAVPVIVLGFLGIVVVVQVYRTLSYNFRPGIEALPIPSVGYETHLASLKIDTETLAGLGFEKNDEFFIDMNPPTVVYAYVHRTEPVYLYLYHMGVKKAYDLVSFFSNEKSLTTTGMPDSGILPPEREILLQVLAGGQLGDLISRHRESLSFLGNRGYGPTRPAADFLRRKLIMHLYSFGDKVKKRAFWPVLLIFWSMTKPGLSVYQYSIEEQVKRGLIDI